jgi:preprotein translocase subunit SecY
MRREQRKERPSLIQSLFDSLSDPELRRKLLFVFAILVIFRFLAHIPVPGVNPEALEAGLELGALAGMMDILVGGALANVSIVAMGVYPYITASIIMQLLIPVIPRLQALSKEGEAGRNKLNQYTHWLTVPLAMLQGYGMMMTFATGMFGGILPLTTPPWPQAGSDLLITVAVVLSMTAGTMFLVWLGERINDYGIGNGISLIIFGGIVCLLPTNILKCYDGTVGAGQAWGFIVLLLLFLAITVLIVFVTEAERRIPVQYSRSVFRGGRAYRQTGGTHIPLKVNSAGMIPLIFAMVLIVLPGTIALWFAAGPNEPPNFANSVVNFFSPGGADAVLGGFPYWSIFFLLVVGFTFFYTMVIFEQQDISGTLQRQGGFIPGIRPGKPTAEHLNRVLNRITWGGALFLGLVAIVPVFSRFIVDTPGSSSLMIVSSAGLLIVVGVALDTMRQLEAQLLMRRYEGFLK